ncbi:MAG: hypothetical protein U5K79_05250 [Cyclobacteriaceae bacterium]|nr:hypothetical protein [Cyclobacteriaceae bacterium]
MEKISTKFRCFSRKEGIEGCGNLSQPHAVNFDATSKISPKNHCVIALMDSNDNDANRAFVTELVRVQECLLRQGGTTVVFFLTNSQLTESQTTS